MFSFTNWDFFTDRARFSRTAESGDICSIIDTYSIRHSAFSDSTSKRGERRQWWRKKVIAKIFIATKLIRWTATFVRRYHATSSQTFWSYRYLKEKNGEKRFLRMSMRDMFIRTEHERSVSFLLGLIIVTAVAFGENNLPHFSPPLHE